MTTTDISHYFFLRAFKLKKNGEAPIYLRLEHFGVRKDISINLSIDPKKWNSNHKRGNGKTDPIKVLNAKLLEIQNKVNQSIRELRNEYDTFSVDDLAAHLRGEKKIRGLKEFYNERFAELKELSGISYSPNSLKVYQTTLNHITEFLKRKMRRADYPLKRVDYHFIDRYFNFLRMECGCNTNTANKYLKTLKAVLNEAKKRKLIMSNPFEHYKIRSGEYDRTYLDQNELQALIAIEPKDPKLDLVKDFFLFSCFTGMHYADIKLLRANHIFEKDGQHWIKKPRQKNGQSLIVPLLPKAKEILEKHS